MASGSYMGFSGYSHILIRRMVTNLAQICVPIKEILREKFKFIHYHLWLIIQSNLTNFNYLLHIWDTKVTDWQTKMNKTKPLTFENLTVLRRQVQAKRDGLTTFQIFNTTFSGGDLSHNQNVKQEVSFHKFIISQWYKLNHVGAKVCKD